MTLYAPGSAQPQLPIKECFAEMSAEIYNQIPLLIMKNQTLAKQRDMLFPCLMSGKLEV